MKRGRQTGIMFAASIMDIALISQIYENPLKLRKKRANNFIERWARDNEQWVHRDKYILAFIWKGAQPDL